MIIIKHQQFKVVNKPFQQLHAKRLQFSSFVLTRLKNCLLQHLTKMSFRVNLLTPCPTNFRHVLHACSGSTPEKKQKKNKLCLASPPKWTFGKCSAFLLFPQCINSHLIQLRPCNILFCLVQTFV